MKTVKRKRLPYTFQESLGYGGKKVDEEKALKILERVGINSVSDLDTTPLMVAAEYGNITLIKYILQEGVNIDYVVPDSYEETALLKACINRRLEAIKLLVGRGANIELPDDQGYTALAYTFMNTFSDPIPSAKYLIGVGAKITENVIRLGMDWNSDKFVEFLEREGIDFNHDLIPKKEKHVAKVISFIDNIQKVHEIEENNDYDKTAKIIWQKLVPSSGQADSVQGELLRAIEKLRDEAQRNGNINFSNNCHKILLSYLKKYLLDEEVFNKEIIKEIKSDLKQISYKTMPYTDDDIFDRLIKRMIDWFLKNSEKIEHTKNKKLYC